MLGFGLQEVVCCTPFAAVHRIGRNFYTWTRKDVTLEPEKTLEIPSSQVHETCLQFYNWHFLRNRTTWDSWVSTFTTSTEMTLHTTVHPIITFTDKYHTDSKQASFPPLPFTFQELWGTWKKDRKDTLRRESRCKTRRRESWCCNMCAMLKDGKEKKVPTKSCRNSTTIRSWGWVAPSGEKIPLGLRRPDMTFGTVPFFFNRQLKF